MDTIDIVQSLAIDTLKVAVDNLASKANTNEVNIWRTIGSSGVIILLFIIERGLTFYNSKRKSKREFLYNIVLLPNANYIRDFFDSYFAQLQSDISDVKIYSGTSDEISSEKRNRLDKLKNIKINFDHQFLSLVRSINKEKAVELTEGLNQLDDIATSCLTSDSLEALNMVDLETKIHANKSKFYAILYK